jgi:hypothetical protein
MELMRKIVQNTGFGMFGKFDVFQKVFIGSSNVAGKT